MSYSYSPEKISEQGMDRMRFELGDVMTDGGSETCALSDEEYGAILKSYGFDEESSDAQFSPAKWRKAKIAVLKGILFRFAYEVDTKVGPLSLSLSERYNRWKALYDELKAEDEAAAVPVGNPRAIKGKPYFRKGIHDNRSGMGGGHIVP